MGCLKILMISAEMAPLAQSGGLGDVVGALPGALRRLGCDVRVILPLYRSVRGKLGGQLRFLTSQKLRLGWRTVYCGYFQATVDGVPCYFVDNEDYFDHDRLYLDYSYDIERFCFFQRAVLAGIGKIIGFEPQILHGNDWQAGMVPLLLDAHYRPQGYWRDVRTLFTIHNLKYQGIASRENIADLLDLPETYFTDSQILHDGVVNAMQAGIVFADRVSTVSPSYAEEILSAFYGEGLHGLLREHARKLSGILNGIDVRSYDPAADPNLVQRYDRRTWREGKTANKKALQKELGLTIDAGRPLAAMIGRMVDQKGFDLLGHILDELLADGKIQLAVLGTGMAEYESRLRAAADRQPDRLSVNIRFDSALARRLYAAADLFLMPSLFEPCGLSQMIAMRYGTLPVVRQTGGLRDTVQSYNAHDGSGNGFGFLNINAHEFLWTTWQARDLVVGNPQAWSRLVETAMATDFSWDRSARAYLELYQGLLADG